MPDLPFDVLCGTRRPERADKSRLVDISRRIEARALTAPAPATMRVSLQHAGYVTDRTAWVYRTIAASGVAVHLYAPGLLPLDDAPPNLHTHDCPAADWAVLLLAGRDGWGLVARDRSRRHEPDDRRTFDWTVTRDRASVAAAADALAAHEPLLLSSTNGPSPV